MRYSEPLAALIFQLSCMNIRQVAKWQNRNVPPDPRTPYPPFSAAARATN